MRLKHFSPVSSKESNKHPLTEGIARADYSIAEIELLRTQREILISKSLPDKEISKELSKLIGHPAGSIKEKIRKLVKSGQLPENPNKREREVFTLQDLQTITSQRSLLIAKNLVDQEISRELSKQLNHSVASIRVKIRQLVKSGQLTENPNKQEQADFSEQELQTIASQRALLITKNLADKEISRELSKLIDHTAGSIETKISKLAKSAQLPENPNKKEQADFSEQELQTIASQRALLITKNLADKEISRELSKQLNHPVEGTYSKIRNLVKSGQLPYNPNNQEREVFTDQELQTIISQRSLLIAKKLTDREISRELSKLIGHSARGIETKISRLVKSGQLTENRNNRKDFDEEELQTIASQRPLLIAKNLADKEISKELSKQLNRSVSSIDAKIRNLVKLGQLPENPNKREHEVFTDQELQTIILQRSLLIAKNLTDKEISRELSKLIDHSPIGINHKIRRLVQSGQLPENPNKREQEVFTDQELQTIASQRSLLIVKTLTDKEISKELSKQLNHPAGAIYSKIRRLVQSGQLPESPNKKGRNLSDSELLGQLTDAVDIYTGEKNE